MQVLENVFRLASRNCAACAMTPCCSYRSDELLDFFQHTSLASPTALQFSMRLKFNPNLTSAWFVSVMELINNVTILAMVIAGGALIR